jgi:hypothetical protein
MDGGHAGNAGSVFRRAAMDGGHAANAGAFSSAALALLAALAETPQVFTIATIRAVT